MKRAQVDDVRVRDVHAERSFENMDLPVRCDGCSKTLSADALDHGEQGFGHYRRCCDCYARKMRGEGRLP